MEKLKTVSRKGKSVVRYPKYYTVKQWKKFDRVIGRDSKGEPVTAQEYLCNTYDIILTDHQTRKEKALKILKAVDITTKEGWENFDKGFKKVDSGFKKFDKAMDDFDKAWAKAFPQSKQKSKLIDLSDIKI